MPRKLLLLLTSVAILGASFASTAQARSLSALIAPTSVCANQQKRLDPAPMQVQAMRCMTNFARRHSGLRPLGNLAGLDGSAADKNHDILRCDDFSHYACGRKFPYWIQRSGYLAAPCWRAGENIAWGTSDAATVRSIFKALVHSPEHLANILGRYSRMGIALKIGHLNRSGKAHVWTQDFGSHCAG
jgi:uncharacterized protein YkwD